MPIPVRRPPSFVVVPGAGRPGRVNARTNTDPPAFSEGFFDLSSGTYPTGIDWTRAVLGTYLAAGTHALSEIPGERALSNTYFAQLIAFFYGQDDQGLRRQAFDDILWVVLGWLEAVKMIDYRKETFEDSEWTGAEWRKPFAQRALEFYLLAEGGWDTALCAGGMLWSPYLDPYKNAITNELYISASIGMYLYNGDRNERYLFNAIRGHEWLRNSNMTNKQGLYTDGFHISNDKGVGEKRCDVRDEMVYTYNQGVLLSGLRGLAEATGDEGYLSEGFELVDAVVTSENRVGEIVRDGILTEKCDIGGYCSQDGHMFKGIFFHHLTLFCEPLPTVSSNNALSGAARSQHLKRCTDLHNFIRKNAAAAWSTRNLKGVVGTWWGAPKHVSFFDKFETILDPGAVDIRNGGGIGCPLSIPMDNTAGGDLNDRGRGRTVESHSGGLAALRAVLRVAERS
ncbi:glycosyl hydrolase family 76-domain-containing protein [Tuber brumale]|nr:glycosyl hydrolase family 76-domain-containing protein [Tuber brumale]